MAVQRHQMKLQALRCGLRRNGVQMCSNLNDYDNTHNVIQSCHQDCVHLLYTHTHRNANTQLQTTAHAHTYQKIHYIYKHTHTHTHKHIYQTQTCERLKWFKSMGTIHNNSTSWWLSNCTDRNDPSFHDEQMCPNLHDYVTTHNAVHLWHSDRAHLRYTHTEKRKHANSDNRIRIRIHVNIHIHIHVNIYIHTHTCERLKWFQNMGTCHNHSSSWWVNNCKWTKRTVRSFGMCTFEPIMFAANQNAWFPGGQTTSSIFFLHLYSGAVRNLTFIWLAMLAMVQPIV